MVSDPNLGGIHAVALGSIRLLESDEFIFRFGLVRLAEIMFDRVKVYNHLLINAP